MSLIRARNRHYRGNPPIAHPACVMAVVRAWRPWPLDGRRLTRRLFWPGFLPLALVGLVLGLSCMLAGSTVGELVLLVWTLAWLGLLSPATMRRGRDAGLARPVAPLLLAPVWVAAGVGLLVPLIVMNGWDARAVGAILVAGLVQAACAAPLLPLLTPTRRSDTAPYAPEMRRSRIGGAR
ncbi:hypothetical protein [Bifidobacterium crudilactis]|jgi:uncharacterized membrane protein YhaH (DUF805 family)|uniref:hypothetical protein n=1 Tax=Bifidobacterium crudilactis TaxID=327277 RepID=UPI0023569290|nr:hypothetical protein [Bifidobacterium crudilactis]MCI1218505.1 hypothetical protein [Bifidobacterium crudilactis]